jgi:hypothetical protein
MNGQAGGVELVVRDSPQQDFEPQRGAGENREQPL